MGVHRTTGMRPGGHGGMRPGGGGSMRPGGSGALRPGGRQTKVTSIVGRNINDKASTKVSVSQSNRVAGSSNGPSLTIKELKKKCISIIKEYIGIRDASEAEACVKELPAEVLNRVGETLVDVSLDTAFNCKAAERPFVEDFLVAMISRKVISSEDVLKGSSDVCEFLQDMKLDMPLCDVWLGRIFGKMLGAGIEGGIFLELFELVKKGGGLRPESLMAGVLLGALQAVVEEHDDSIRSTMVAEMSSSTGFRMLEAITARELICEAGDFSQGQRVLDQLESINNFDALCGTMRCAVQVQKMLTKQGNTIDEVLQMCSDTKYNSIISHP